MVGSSWSSSSSCTSSFGSLDDDDVISVVKMRDAGAVPPEGSVKFLCSYGGRILPRQIDGALRYVGGNNRVVSVDRSSLHYYELQRKLREMCGWDDDDVSLRCQLPSEDLDALVSVTSDDDLANLLEEYDAASKDRLRPLKIRAFLFPRTPALSPNFLRFHRQNCSPATSARMPSPVTCAPRWSAAPQASRPAQSRPHWYLVHNGSHWQRQAYPSSFLYTS